MRFLLSHLFVFLFIFHCSCAAKQEPPKAEDLKVMAKNILTTIYNNNHKSLPNDLQEGVNRGKETDTIAITVSTDENGQFTFAVASNIKKLKEKEDYNSLKTPKYPRDFEPYALKPGDYDEIRKEIKKKYPVADIHVVETKDPPANLDEMREPHAEMVLLKYQMNHLHPTKKLKILAIGASKTACELCYEEQENVKQAFDYVMEYEKRKDDEKYTPKGAITNWLNPQHIGKLKKTDITGEEESYSSESIEEMDHAEYAPCNDSVRASKKPKKGDENNNKKRKNRQKNKGNCKPMSSQNSRKVFFRLKQLMHGKNKKFASRLMRTNLFTKNKKRLMKSH